MKVCHITSVHMAKDVRIFHKQCVSLAKNGYEVYIVAPGEPFEESGVKVLGIPKPRSRFERFFKTGRLAYEKALGLDATVYHLHDPELLPYGIKLKKKGKIVIFDSHEDIWVHLTNKNWIPRPLHRSLERIANLYFMRVLRKMDATITVTPHICDKFEGIAKHNVMITNYPICEAASVPHPVFTGKTLCYTGVLGNSRNLETILQALMRFEEKIFILVGKTTDTYLASLKEYPGWKKTIYKGYVSRAEMWEIVNTSDIGVFVVDYYSNYENKTGSLGNTKLFEYMMAGLPVICSDHVLFREIIEGCHCGICIPPGDVERMVEAIAYLCEHPEEAAEMGCNGQSAVRETYNWGTQEKVLLDLYQTLSAEAV